jgi:hypothetical protein
LGILAALYLRPKCFGVGEDIVSGKLGDIGKLDTIGDSVKRTDPALSNTLHYKRLRGRYPARRTTPVTI